MLAYDLFTGFYIRMGKRICSYRSKFFLQELTNIEKGGKNENGRVASPENVPIHLKQLPFKKEFFLTRELSLINTCCWRADHEILMHDGGAGVH